MTQGLLTSGRLVSIPPQKNRVKELARTPQPDRELKLQGMIHFFPQSSYFLAEIPPMYVPPATLNAFSNPKKMLRDGCLHHHGHEEVLHMDVGSSWVVHIRIKDVGEQHMLLSQRTAIGETTPHTQTLTLFCSHSIQEFSMPRPTKERRKKIKGGWGGRAFF